MLDSNRFKLAPRGGTKSTVLIEVSETPSLVIADNTIAPDFTRLELVGDADFEHAFAATLPPQNLEPEQLLSGCIAIFESQERFELNAEARKLLMVLAEVRWLTAFANREYFKEYGAENITEFIKGGNIRTESGRALGLRNWYQHKEIVSTLESLLQRIRQEQDKDQNRLLRRVLELGPTKLLILNQIQKLKGEEFFHQFVLGIGMDDSPLTVATMNPHNSSVNDIKGWLELLRTEDGSPDKTASWLTSLTRLHEVIVQRKVAIPENQKGELRKWLEEILAAID
jgi:hypothetical protein